MARWAGRHPLVQRAYFALWDRVAHGEATVETPHGRITVNLTDRYIGRPLFMTGVYEPGVGAVLRRYLRPGMVAVDIGAHIGHHTLLMARSVGLEGRVYAFEPEPANRRLLVRNMEANDAVNVILRTEAVASRTGTARLHLSPSNHGGHSLAVSRHGPVLPVPTVTLPDALGPDARVGLVKLDIEGGELDALAGMAPILFTQYPTLVVEYWPAGLRAAGNVPLSLATYLWCAGYHLHAIHERTGALRLVTEAELRRVEARSGFVNLLCVRWPCA